MDTEKTKAAPEEAEAAAKPAFWAVLPAAVRYDGELPPNAKLLYAEISALTDQRGYCYASNEYFMRLYGLGERTIRRLLSELQRRGFVTIADGDGGKDRRKIYAGINPLANNPAKNGREPGQNFPGNPAKNGPHNKKENKKENNPPIAPQGAGEGKALHWKPERFEAFWRYYPAIPDGNGHGRRPAKDRAIRAWDKLRPDEDEIAAMGRALKTLKQSRQWREGVGIPYASTWLNSRAWRDETEDLPTPAMRAAHAAGEDEIEWV